MQAIKHFSHEEKVGIPSFTENTVLPALENEAVIILNSVKDCSRIFLF